MKVWTSYFGCTAVANAIISRECQPLPATELVILPVRDIGGDVSPYPIYFV
jgi:hypothetical protein